MKRRTTAGGGSLLAWRFAFFVLIDPRTSCMTCGPGPACHRLGCFGARRVRFSVASRGASGRVCLEKGFTPHAVVTLPHSLQSLRPFAFELSVPLCIRTLPLSAAVVAMASLVHPERFQSKGALNLVCNLLDWSAPAFAGRIRAGATPLGDLAAGQFVLFVSYLSCGLALPISPFFLLLLEEFGLQLQHLKPHSILQAAIFSHLCEMFVGVALLPPEFGRKGVAQRPSRDGKRVELRLHLSSELHCLLQRPRQLLLELHQHLVVRLHELVQLWLPLSGQATERRALPRLHLFGFDGLDVASNDEGSFTLMHASRRPMPLASCSTRLLLAPLFPVAATVFRVRGRPTPGGAEGGCPWAVVVIASPVADTKDAAREVVQDAVETTATRFQRDPADVE
jgi:hypothetical protein